MLLTTFCFEAGAAVILSFDTESSDISGGVYAFNLSYTSAFGAAEFKLSEWDSIGNTSQLQEVTTPSAFDLSEASRGSIVYKSEEGSSQVSGGEGSRDSGILQFLVRGDQNLSGSVLWELGGEGLSGSGSVIIQTTPVPEPEQFALLVAVSLLLVMVRSKFERARDSKKKESQANSQTLFQEKDRL